MHIGAARWGLSSHQGQCLSNFEQTQSLPVRDYGTNSRLVSGSFLFRRSGPLFLFPCPGVTIIKICML